MTDDTYVKHVNEILNIKKHQMNRTDFTFFCWQQYRNYQATHLGEFFHEWSVNAADAKTIYRMRAVYRHDGL